MRDGHDEKDVPRTEDLTPTTFSFNNTQYFIITNLIVTKQEDCLQQGDGKAPSISIEITIYFKFFVAIIVQM